MVKPALKDRIDHIINAINNIKDFIADTDLMAFLKDVKLQSAVQYQFLLIGEAIRNIDKSMLAKYDYPWHIPLSFRNFIIHEYRGMRMERIFYAAKDLDDLENTMKQISSLGS